MPRINFVSFTFLFAFGLGSFAGIGMALLAVALARPEDETTVIQPTPAVVARAPTNTPSPTATPVPTETPVPPPRTLTALQVRIGPDEGYAILGTLASGSEIGLQGRDSSGDWLAIEFPPGSSARGWIPADAVGSLTLAQVFSLEVLQASIVETAPRFPFSTATPTLLEGNDGVPTAAAASPSVTATQPASVTPGPAPLNFGPTDLAVASVSLSSDGNVRIVVQNLGPRDVTGLNLEVAVPGLQSEVLSTGIMRAGDSVSFLTVDLLLTERATVFVTADPNNLLSDLDRTNNSRTVTLTP